MMIHRYEASILRTLRWAEASRFSQLMQPTGLTSDSFKFYLRKLQKSGHVEKGQDGLYRLTADGKEYANNLDDRRLERQKQPKLSIVAVVCREGVDGNKEYLFQERLRQPFLHYWGLISGPILWGQTAEDTAAHEMTKQTGLSANFRLSGFCRVRDYLTDGGLLEDKLFMVMTTDSLVVDPDNVWGGGRSAWMSLDALQSQPHYFHNTVEFVRMVENGTPYMSSDRQYDETEY
jgi:predicted transcriptional regulator